MFRKKKGSQKSHRERRSNQICVNDTVAKEAASNSHTEFEREFYCEVKGLICTVNPYDQIQWTTVSLHTTTCEERAHVSGPRHHTWTQKNRDEGVRGTKVCTLGCRSILNPAGQTNWAASLTYTFLLVWEDHTALTSSLSPPDGPAYCRLQVTEALDLPGEEAGCDLVSHWMYEDKSVR